MREQSEGWGGEPPPQTPGILSVFATFAFGGPQARFAAIANHLGGACRHRIVAMDGRLDAREMLSREVHAEFPDLGLVRTDTPGNLRRIFAYLRRTRPDVLVTSNWGSIDWAIGRAGSGVRHIHMEDGFGPEERDRQIGRRVLTRRLVLRRSDVVLPSRTLEHIARDIWRLPARRLHYIPNGVDLARFAGGRPATLPPGAGPVIGTVAALRAEKNIARLLHAFSTLRAVMPARLVIVGDGPERTPLMALARDLGLGADVHFPGHSSAPEYWLAAFDLFALSSDTEQMPLSLLEAMAASRPAVATDVGDVRDMLAPENRPFVTPRDAPALAEAMRRLLQEAPAAAIGAANRRRAEAAFSDKQMFAAHAELLGVVEGREPRENVQSRK